MRLWIKDPLAILAARAERGVVVEGSQIVECVARGRSPGLPCDATFDASRHVLLPGLVNAHHHFYQTLTRAHPAGQGLELIPWLVAMEHVWGRMTPEGLRVAVRMALVELLLSAAPPPPTIIICSRPASRALSTSRWTKRGSSACA